jgi:hypothetical protein
MPAPHFFVEAMAQITALARELRVLSVRTVPG